MAAIKSADRIKAKWKRVTAAAQTEYEEGIDNPRTDWATATKAAEKNYEQGVQQSISRKSFGKGVSKAGTDKWQKNAREKGPTRFTQGVNLSEDRYAEGFEPYRRVIETTSLPARGPKGDPSNINRVATIAKALHDEKLKRAGS